MPSEQFYEYYALLGVPLPPAADWLNDTVRVTKTPSVHSASSSSSSSSSSAAVPAHTKESASIAPDSVKKLYRKASLKHHPDRGGDPSQFIKLKRAAKVLADPGLRNRYDILGIDSELDDCATNPSDPDQSGEESPNENNSATKLQELSGVVSAALVSVFLRTLLVYAILFFIKYKWVNVAGTIGIIFVAAVKLPGVERNIKLLVGCLPLLLWLVWYSGQGGWFFWIFESAALSLTVLLGLDPPFNRIVLFGICVGAMVLGWFFQGSFWSYFTVLCVEIFMGLVCLLFFPLCESLVKEAIDASLKIYAEKMKSAMQKQREEDRKAMMK
ncbi:hypothetical protein TrST_g2578 [Triparma strigata]|uniref:J domain-containing protein n=1 Tax=Triparma strigata TaxID=1606541 RepID=A0A9W7EVZ5_9STRA|nr:hypothetical protein TrST_g2578 [Triparma strigata]